VRTLTDAKELSKLLKTKVVVLPEITPEQIEARKKNLESA